MIANQNASKYLKFFALVALSALLSVTTVVLGGLPLLAARRMSSKLLFWLVQVAVALGFALTGFPFYGLVILAQTILVGVYVEVEEHGSSVFTSGATAILASVGTVVIAAGLWVKLNKVQVVEQLRLQIDPLVEQISAASSSSNGKSAVTTAAVIQQLPSAIVIGLILSLALALIADKRTGALAKLGEYKSGSSEALRAFRLPDGFVWLVVLAVAGAFLKHGKPAVELVSVNLLNILVVLYFFQGLAVISQAFRTFKVSGVWQAVWYVLLVLQLFLMVSLIGFADYWLEFRQRLTRKPAETNRGF